VFRSRLPLALLAGLAPVLAHDPITTRITWTREVSRIVYARCVSCHRQDGAAFSLSRYEEARPWAAAIKEEVLMRRMPPWNAVKGFGHFRNDRGLTQQELGTIADWVEGGAPEGDPRHLPAMPAPSAPETTPKARPLPVSNSTNLDRRIAALGIRVAGSIQVFAVRPDGSIEPLVWVRQSNPAADGVYWFQTKIVLPPRTRIQTVPPDGSATLLIE
jgi:hypothetical protein